MYTFSREQLKAIFTITYATGGGGGPLVFSTLFPLSVFLENYNLVDNYPADISAEAQERIHNIEYLEDIDLSSLKNIPLEDKKEILAMLYAVGDVKNNGVNSPQYDIALYFAESVGLIKQ